MTPALLARCGGLRLPAVIFVFRKSACRRRVNSMAIPSRGWPHDASVVLPMVSGAPIWVR